MRLYVCAMVPMTTNIFFWSKYIHCMHFIGLEIVIYFYFECKVAEILSSTCIYVGQIVTECTEDHY